MTRDQLRLLAIGGAALGGLSFFGVRLAMRKAVYNEIENSSSYKTALTVAGASALFGVNLGMPTASEWAEALVPLFGINSPYEAARDIQQYGRQSRYWPAAYRTSDIRPDVEVALINTMVAIAEREPTA